MAKDPNGNKPYRGFLWVFLASYVFFYNGYAVLIIMILIRSFDVPYLSDFVCQIYTTKLKYYKERHIECE